ncbi:hypothetical protein BJX99DRAFT_261142 [Aspergillus californicus]
MNTKYEEIQNGEDGSLLSSDDNSSREQLYREIKRRKRLYRLVVIQWGILVAMTLFIAIGTTTVLRDRGIRIPDLLYSPAKHLIEYEKVTFSGGFNTSDKSPYGGFPDEENNKAWEDLYNYGIIKIPQSEAAKLHTSTMPLPGDPTAYMVEIEVFHELHCLNHLRKLAWGTPISSMGVDPANETEINQFWVHVDHCVNSVRQSLMCAADISTIHWSWVQEDQMWEADPQTVHTCRDFEAIRDWAFENRVGAIDRAVWVEDPLRVNGHFP